MDRGTPANEVIEQSEIPFQQDSRFASYARRGSRKYENRVPLYRGIEIGDASVLLNLTFEQYLKLIAA